MEAVSSVQYVMELSSWEGFLNPRPRAYLFLSFYVMKLPPSVEGRLVLLPSLHPFLSLPTDAGICRGAASDHQPPHAASPCAPYIYLSPSSRLAFLTNAGIRCGTPSDHRPHHAAAPSLWPLSNSHLHLPPSCLAFSIDAGLCRGTASDHRPAHAARVACAPRASQQDDNRVSGGECQEVWTGCGRGPGVGKEVWRAGRAASRVVQDVGAARGGSAGSWERCEGGARCVGCNIRW